MIPLLFLHGAGAAAGDPPLPALRRALGPGYEITAPDLGEPDAGAWSRAIKAAISAIGPSAILAGHSLGASHLLKCLAELGPAVRPRGMVGLATPFWGETDWNSTAFALPDWGPDALARLPIRLFHGTEDKEVPPSHLDRWGQTLPGARLYRLDGQGHDFGGDLAAVAMAIAEL